MSAVELKDLTRVFSRGGKEFRAVQGITLTVEPEQVFCFLGPNGAGKTTTIKILTTLLTPTSGEARVLGFDVQRDFREIRRRINFVYGGERGLYGRLNAEEHLTYFADLYHVDLAVQKRRIPELLERVGLRDAAKVPVEKYSKGMKQRLHIARGLINDPEILFLDEPTIGLDPVGARDLRQIVRSLVEMKKTVFLTTHYMAEAEELSRNIAIINQGQLAAHGTLDSLRERVSTSKLLDVQITGELAEERLRHLRSLPFVLKLEHQSSEGLQSLRAELSQAEESVVAFLSHLQEVPIQAVMMRKPSLEDTYLQIVEGKVSV